MYLNLTNKNLKYFKKRKVKKRDKYLKNKYRKR